MATMLDVIRDERQYRLFAQMLNLNNTLYEAVRQ